MFLKFEERSYFSTLENVSESIKISQREISEGFFGGRGEQGGGEGGTVS